MSINGPEAHMRLNQLLEGTQYTASTTESHIGNDFSCAVRITWLPTPRQILKAPKVVYEASRLTWDAAYEACASWIKGTVKHQ